jgi:predicted secreted Zn-dependent protease
VTLRLLSFSLSALLLSTPAFADWKPQESTKFYRVSGTTEPELYASIGERGPQMSLGRTIAQTTFKLTWQRKYENQNGACVLARAVPRLLITYHLPKPANALPEPVKTHWTKFSAGVERHEKFHGVIITDMVRAIERETVGLRVENDPGCTRIKTEMTRRLAALSQAQRQRSREYDRVELGDGGPVHRLILEFVNRGATPPPL